MTRMMKKVALACVAGTLAVGVAVGAASAAGPMNGHMGPGPGHGGPPRMAHIGGPGHGPWSHDHRWRRGVVFGVGDTYYGGDYYGGCGYYRVRWHETGSHYWRERYLDCVDG